MDPLPSSYFSEQIENTAHASKRRNRKQSGQDIKLQLQLNRSLGEIYREMMIALGLYPSIEEATEVYLDPEKKHQVDQEWEMLKDEYINKDVNLLMALFERMI